MLRKIYYISILFLSLFNVASFGVTSLGFDMVTKMFCMVLTASFVCTIAFTMFHFSYTKKEHWVTDMVIIMLSFMSVCLGFKFGRIMLIESIIFITLFRVNET